MKINILATSLFFSISYFAEAAITWDGEAGDGLWSTNTNWVGDIIPGASDDVILDNSVVTGAYTVTLPAGTVSIFVNTLAITSAGLSAITFIIPNTNTASPVFTVSGPGDALILDKGAIFRNSSGATSGSSLVITNKFRINNGGRYIHNTARGNAAIVSQLSTVAGTEEGEFEFDVPAASQTISLTGRTFGTLILSSTARGGHVTYSGNGASPLNIKGSLQIGADVTFSSGMSADISIRKKLIQAATSVFNLQNSTNNNIVKVYGDIEILGTLTEMNTGLPVLELNGTTQQNIAINSVLNDITVKINNTSGAILMSPLTLPYRLILTNGKLKTDATNLLILADNATSTNGSAASFVEGPVKKIGDDNFNFPIGSGSIYAPIGIAGNGGNVTDEFIAEYKRQNPQSTPGLGNSIDNTIKHISSIEYWEITRAVGSSTKNIQFMVHEYSFAKKLNTLLAARFSAGQWRNEGGTNFTTGTAVPPYITGTFESSSSVGNFGAFTLATTDDVILNPLPIKLVSFNVSKSSDKTSMLRWTVAENCLPGEKFELQRSSGNHVFEAIAIINGNESNRIYEHKDETLMQGVSYYRLKMTDAEKAITYSHIVSVLVGAKDKLVSFLAPTLVTNTAVLTITSLSDQCMDLVISDIHGRIVRRQRQRLNAGSTNINLLLSDISKGIYHISFTTNKGDNNVIRFLKQ